MKKYDRYILEKLLSKYERSLVSRNANNRTQNIWFTVTEKSIPEYFDVTSAAYETVNRDARALEMAGLVSLTWKNNLEDHILEKVQLNLFAIEAAYAHLGRNARNVQIEKLFSFMDAYAEEHNDPGTPVSRCFDYIRQRISNGLSVKKYVDLHQPDPFYDAIKGASAVLSNERECFEREFSMAIYGDSKRFEQLKSTIRAVLCDFGGEGDDEGEPGGENSETVFADHGILEKPSTVLIKGCGKAFISDAVIDLSALTQGMGFAGDDLSSVEWIEDHRVRQIITIENLTAFYRFSCPGAVIVYLGGFSNRVRVQLLKALHQAYPEANLLHFGDIDLGGFRILLDLRHKTGLDVKPLHMDVPVLEKYRGMCRPLTAADQNGLKKLLEKLTDKAERQADAERMPQALIPWEESVEAAIRWMLENSLKLEQEIVVYELMGEE